MNTITNCYNCHSTNLVNHANVPDRHYGIKGEFNLSKCAQCGLVFMNPMPTEEELKSFYPEESYYSYHVDIYRQISPLKNWLIRLTCLDTIPKDVSFSSPGTVLDIGCGNGWNLYQYKQQGWKVAGVEPSKIAAEIGNQAGLNIYNGDLLSAGFEANSFDYIRLNHSFEHIHNPDEILSEIHRILKPDGKVFIGVPNIAGVNSKIFKKYWYYLGAPVHTFNYNTDTLRQMLEKNNFKVIKTNYNGNWAGFLGSIQIYLNRKSGKPSDQGFFVNFVFFKMVSGFIAKIQNLFHSGDCIELIATKEMP